MRRFLGSVFVAALVAFLGIVACRQIADIQDDHYVESGSPDIGPVRDTGPDHPNAPDAAKDAPASNMDAGPCSCPHCTILASNQNTPMSLALAGKNLYVANYGSGATEGSIVEVPISGGTTTTLVSGLTGPYSIVTDQSHIYWIDQAGTGATDGVLQKRSLSGGNPTPLATGFGAIGTATAPTVPLSTQIAVTTTTVYWVHNTPLEGTATSPYSVRSVPIDGGKFSVFLDGLPPGIGNDAGADAGLYLEGSLFPVAIQTDGKSLFVMNFDGTSGCSGVCLAGIFKTSFSGGASETVVSKLTHPDNFALTETGTVVYMEDPKGSTGSLNSILQDGGMPLVLASDLLQPWAVATDGTSAYGVNNGVVFKGIVVGAGSIFKAPLAAGKATTVATSQTPQAAVVDNENVYWVDSTCGTVMKAAK